MGEEVREPRRTIPRAIVISLSLALAIYLVIAVISLSVLGPAALAASPAPLAEVASAGGWTWTVPVVRAAAALAALGALLALTTGVSRTIFAMARERDLPAPLARIHAEHRVPRTAVLVVGALVIVLGVGRLDLRSAIGFSSFGVLRYYLVANLAALRQRGENRRYPRALQVLGGRGRMPRARRDPPDTRGGHRGGGAAGAWRRVSRRQAAPSGPRSAQPSP